MTSLFKFLVAGVEFVLMAIAAYAGDADKYLVVKDNVKQLKAPLQLEEEQGGAGGRTLMLWTVEPSGHWKVESVYKDTKGEVRLRKVRESGTLSQAELIQLAGDLARGRIEDLPDKLGPDSKLNPHRYTIRFGDDYKVVLTGPGTRRAEDVRANITQATPSKAVEDVKEWMRFAELAGSIASHCRKPPSP